MSREAGAVNPLRCNSCLESVIKRKEWIPQKMKRVALAVVLTALTLSMPASAMTNEQQTAFLGHFRNQLMRCFTPPFNVQSGKARVEIHLAPDGSLARPPKLIGPSADPASAQAALRAVSRCAPFRIPSEFTSSYDKWRLLQVEFDHSQ